MRSRGKQKLLICGTCIGTIIFIYLAWKTNETFSVWTGLSSAGFVSSLTLSYHFFKDEVQHTEKMLEHSNNLIQNVFQTKVVTYGIIYDKDMIKLVKPNQQFGDRLVDLCGDKDAIYKLCVEWNESNPMLYFAKDHLKHKKYVSTWQAYINGVKYAEVQIDKIFEVVERYRETVEYHLDNAKLSLKVSENEKSLKIGEYSKKRINHLIFYDVSKKIETGATNKKLGLFTADLNKTSDTTIFRLSWCDYHKNAVGMLAGDNVAVGDETSMKYLLNVLEQIENDDKIRALILEFDYLKRSFENNLELKRFEAGRKEIVNQINNKKEVLAGKCNQCP